MTKEQKTRNNWRWWLCGIMAIGALLRLWNVQSQLILDDEWHALNFVLERSFKEVLFQQGLGANSIPVNIYSWMALHTIGWSELVLRLPSLLAGILALVVLPLLVKRLWGKNVALIGATLMAVSPVLIFYSRVARPYGPVMLFAPASVLLTLAWIREGRRQDIVWSAISGSIAIYYHLYAVIPVIVPLFIAGLASLPAVARHLAEPVRSRRPFTDLVTAAVIVLAVIGPLVVLPNLLFPWWTSVHGMDKATTATALTAARILAGTHLFLPAMLSVALLMFGIRIMLKESLVSGAAFVAPLIFFIGIMATTTQDGAHAGIQAARYGISFFPLAFMAVGIAIAKLGMWLEPRLPAQIKPLSLMLTAALMTPSLATSPLWRTYDSPNNFTGHSAFQYRYELRDWSQRSPERDLVPGISMRSENMSKIYRDTQLLRKYKGIVEFPMLMGDHLNLLYYFQHFHGLPVAVGYFPSLRIDPNPPGRQFVTADMPVEYVLASVPEKYMNNMRWRSMANLDDLQGLKQKYGNWLLIVHFNPLREVFEDGSPDMHFVTQAKKYLEEGFGSPSYVDQHVAAWEIR